MALQVPCSLVGRGFAASPSLPVVPLNRLRPCCRQTGSWDDLRVNLSDFRKGWGLELGCGLRPRFERVPCCARLGGDVAGVESCKSQLSGGEASFMARMAGILEILRSLALGGDCNSSCPASARQWRAFPAALLCSCAVVTPGMASPVAAVEPVPASDFLVALLTLGGALGILQFFDELAKRNLLEKKLSRKLCHILSGLVFMLFWPFFSSAPLAKYMAAFAPFANGVRMIGLGLGLWRNEALVKAISREGGQRELLQGPLYYAITITIATLCFWRYSPIGACAVATLCAGDGFADIVGRKYGSLKFPYNSDKSLIGSVAFFVFASLASMGFVAYFSAFGFFTATARMYMATMWVALASALVESLPLPLDDNFTVPFTAIAAGMLLLPY